MRNSKTQDGFTLIELMIVVAIISIIASIAIPNLMESKKLVSERLITTTLKSVRVAQALFREKAELDSNGNSIGEYAVDWSQLTNGPTSNKTFIRLNIHPSSAAIAEKNGYLFKLIIPSTDAGGTPSDDEEVWACMAWPIRYNKTGYAIFATTETNIVYTNKNTLGAYSGIASPLNVGDLFSTPFDNATISTGAAGFIGMR